jgi:hypothetical protein
VRILCELSAPFVANAAVETSPIAAPIRIHVDRCLRCRSRHAAMTKTARELRALAGVVEPAPIDLEWRVMSSLEGDLAIARSWRRPLALVAALLSMGLAFFLWKMRPRTS